MVYFAALGGAWLYFRQVAPKEREKASPVILSVGIADTICYPCFAVVLGFF